MIKLQLLLYIIIKIKNKSAYYAGYYDWRIYFYVALYEHDYYVRRLLMISLQCKTENEMKWKCQKIECCQDTVYEYSFSVGCWRGRTIIGFELNLYSIVVINVQRKWTSYRRQKEYIDVVVSNPFCFSFLLYFVVIIRRKSKLLYIQITNECIRILVWEKCIPSVCDWNILIQIMFMPSENILQNPCALDETFQRTLFQYRFAYYYLRIRTINFRWMCWMGVVLTNNQYCKTMTFSQRLIGPLSARFIDFILFVLLLYYISWGCIFTYVYNNN